MKGDKMIEEIKIRGFDVQDNEEMLNALLEVVDKLNEVIEAVNELKKSDDFEFVKGESD